MRKKELADSIGCGYDSDSRPSPKLNNTGDNVNNSRRAGQWTSGARIARE